VTTPKLPQPPGQETDSAAQRDTAQADRAGVIEAGRKPVCADGVGVFGRQAGSAHRLRPSTSISSVLRSRRSKRMPPSVVSWQRRRDHRCEQPVPPRLAGNIDHLCNISCVGRSRREDFDIGVN
jgi:hypothetical protein